MVGIFNFYTISRMLEKLKQSKIVCFSAKDTNLSAGRQGHQNNQSNLLKSVVILF